MLTPRFKLRQDDDFLYVLITLPYVKISDCEVYIDGCTFSCYVKPYLLNLTLPHQLVEDGREKACYDVDRGVLECRVPKRTAGVEFEDLELIANLLSPKKAGPLRSKIEVVGGATFEVEAEELPRTDYRYGFNRGFADMFASLPEELAEIADLDPAQVSIADRLTKAESIEQSAFDLDRYLDDLDDEAIQDLLEVPFPSLFSEFLPSLSELMEPMSLDAMVRLGNKDQLVNSALFPVMYCQIFDIALAFSYDLRSMSGDFTCESAYNINKLAVSLACLAEVSDPAQVLRFFTRRVLVFGIFRTVEACARALDDAKQLFNNGRLCLVRILLKVKSLFERAEPRYLLNRLFIDDLVIWIQKTDAEGFANFHQQINDLRPIQIEATGLDFSFAD